MKQKYTNEHKEKMLKEMAKDKERRLNIIMPAKEYKKFSIKCMEIDTNMSDWIRSKIDEFIKGEDKQ